MRFASLLLVIASTFALSHCVSYDFANRTAQQGNLLPEIKVKRLQVGMNKQEVATLMGTSLLSPMFTNDRWDYAYTWRRGNKQSTAQNVVLYFKNDTLVKIEHTL